MSDEELFHAEPNGRVSKASSMYAPESIGTLLPRSARRKSRRHTAATTPQQDDEEDRVWPPLTPEDQKPHSTDLLISRIGRALCPHLQRRSPKQKQKQKQKQKPKAKPKAKPKPKQKSTSKPKPKPNSLPIDDVPRLRFDDCHHEVHISGGGGGGSARGALSTQLPAQPPATRPTPQLQPAARQRRTSLLARARTSCLEKLDDARLARRCCCMRVAGRLGCRGGGVSRLRASTTSCCSTTPWSSSTNVGVSEAVRSGGGGGWALEIYFAMEFEVQSEPRPDPTSQAQASSRLPGMSSVGCRAAP
ncbi:hypothetical protein MCOR28_005740 [Pyricularia oryzae]|nr:hypothetical protein MCOR26_001387 [Pyricularia oryzae]KAI6341876.1 hypothetical protein MCOR28_005740 [Pyricularia oryzae]KAI6441798.1 hypothetical protein MCOR22_006269 [Pyricularia oryzae]